MAAGKDVRLTWRTSAARSMDLEGRLETARRNCRPCATSSPPPRWSSAGPGHSGGPAWQRKGEARMVRRTPPRAARIERLAMQRRHERRARAGARVIDVSAQKCGWDITLPARPGRQAARQRATSKSKAAPRAATTITVTRNEILYGLNQADKFILAIVLVDGEQHEGPFYVRQPFTQEPDWAVTSINLDLEALLSRSSHSGGSL